MMNSGLTSLSTVSMLGIFALMVSSSSTRVLPLYIHRYVLNALEENSNVFTPGYLYLNRLTILAAMINSLSDANVVVSPSMVSFVASIFTVFHRLVSIFVSGSNVTNPLPG